MSDIQVKFWSTLPKTPFDIGVFYPGTPQSSEVIFSVIMVRNVTYNPNFSGSAAQIEGTLSNTFVITIQKNDADVGTISFDTSGNATFANTDNTQFTIDDKLSLLAPLNIEPGIDNIKITLAGLRS